MKKWSIIVVLAVALGGVAYWWFGTNRTAPLTESRLTFAEVKPATIRDVVSATGLVEPRERIIVGSVLSGTIEHLFARVGDLVSEGKPLAQLDDRAAKLKVAEARNAIFMAQAGTLQARASLKQALANKDAAQV